MAPAPDHREVDAGDGARNGDRHDVRVGVAARRLDRLLVLHGRERRDAVPVEGGLLEGPGLGCLPHAPFIILDDVARAPLEKGGGALDVLRVVILRDGAHAGRRAAADLAEQARAVAVREDGVLAGPQAEDLLHDLDRLAHGRPVGIGPEEAGLAIDAAAIVGEPRKRLGTEPQIGITLVVPEEDVVLRAQRLDEVVLKKKGLRLAARDGGLESGDLAHHDRDARGEPRGIAEVGRDALLEVARLADVEACARCVEVAVASGQVRKGPDLLMRIEGGLRRGVLGEDDPAGGIFFCHGSALLNNLTTEVGGFRYSRGFSPRGCPRFAVTPTTKSLLTQPLYGKGRNPPPSEPPELALGDPFSGLNDYDTGVKPGCYSG